jgi:hypothetical protein
VLSRAKTLWPFEVSSQELAVSLAEKDTNAKVLASGGNVQILTGVPVLAPGSI